LKIIFKMLTTKKKDNNLKDIFEQSRPLLGIYFSAGYPYLNATADILEILQENRVDFVEVGMPYSDPLADGPVIEACHSKALANGMNISLMFNQLKEIKAKITVPVVLMGYFNPVYKYGLQKFCKECADAGISALILPDMPVEEYEEHYRHIFQENNIDVIFLATPQTPEERLKLIDKYSNPFIYLVSSSSTTGKTRGISDEQAQSFLAMKGRVSKPVMVGFGISTNQDFTKVNSHADGAIVGSAFLKAIEGAINRRELKDKASSFINSLKGNL
jgi:tryptophan synthase alpha chain